MYQLSAILNLKSRIMKRILFTIFITISALAIINAQDYKTGIGIRAGFSSGLTVKHFTSHKAAIEGLLKTRWQGFDVTGLYEIHKQAFDVRYLNWYYGGGGHIGFYNGDNTNWGRDGYAYTVVGIDGILGIEYNFGDLPVNIGLDWKPVLNLIGYSGFWSEGAFSIRYIF